MGVYEGFTINDDKIIFKATRLNGDCGLKVSYDPYEQINSQELTQNFEKYKNEISDGKYEVKYLGNDKFSSVKNIGYSKLQDSVCY